MPDMPAAPRPRLRLQYFDGRHASAQQAEIWCEGRELLLQTGDGRQQRYALRQVQWPERQRHGQRQVLLPDGGVLSCAEAADWDDWAQAAGLRESLAVHWAQSWRLTLTAGLLLMGLLILLWWQGLPLAARAISELVPAPLEAQLGERTLQSLDGLLLKPSALPAARQAAITQDFAGLVARARARGEPWPEYQLVFRQAGDKLGPNALALPGGTLVLTDALAELLADQPDALAGVLAHELGHVRGRHGLRMTVQAGLASTLGALMLGDFSGVLASAPAVLSSQAYSRALEREADAAALHLLRADGRKPRAMLAFFDRIAQQRQARKAAEPSGWATAIASHPDDAERRRFFGGE